MRVARTELEETVMKYELAKIVDTSDLVEFQKDDEFLEFINQDPDDRWLEDHPMVKGVKYLPIGKVELLLTKIYQHWRVEVLREGQLLNSVYCTVRLHYRHPITKEWEFQDGVAAVPAKTDKDAKASDMSAIKSDAVMTGLPAAKSFAIKDAADHIGKIFGRDINRKGNLIFNGSYKQDLDTTPDMLAQFKSASSEAEIEALLASLPADQQLAFASVAKHRVEEIQNGSKS